MFATGILKRLCTELEHRFIKLGVLACLLYFSLQLQLNDLGLLNSVVMLCNYMQHLEFRKVGTHLDV